MKKFLALLLALAMTLALAACGGDGQKDNGQKDNGASSSGVTIKVGGIGPLTGDAAQYGTATAWGAQIAVDEINALNGPVQLDYRFEDDTGVADTAVSAYNTLKDWAKDAPPGHLRLHHHHPLRGRGLRGLCGPLLPADALRLLPRGGQRQG